MSEITQNDERRHGIDTQSAVLLALGWVVALWVTLS